MSILGQITATLILLKSFASKDHFTKVYSNKECELTNFPGIRPIGISGLHTLTIPIRRIPGKFVSYEKWPLGLTNFWSTNYYWT